MMTGEKPLHLTVMAHLSHTVQDSAVQKFLEDEKDPLSKQPLLHSNFLKSAEVKEKVLTLVLECHPKDSDIFVSYAKALEGKTIEGIEAIKTVVSTEKITPSLEKRRVPGVKRIIAVASGKGGVGKSTTAVMIARSLEQQGEKVGLLDADIYGPSIPTMLGLRGKKPEVSEHKKLIPLEAFNIKVMSIGFMIPENSAMIWRGPMIQSAFLQLLFEVEWNGVDTLILDLPPGTGDIQLTLAQKIHMDGAVIVSTPQDIALMDARRAVSMFQRVGVPILGMIENMSTFTCPHCQKESHIFDHGQARTEAERLNIPFLAEIPLDIRIRKSLDQGEIEALPHISLFQKSKMEI